MKEFLFTIFDIGPLFLQWCTIVEHGTATRNMIAHISTTAALFPPPSHHHSLLYPFHYCRQPYKSNTGATTQRIKIPTPTKVVDFVANVVREVKAVVEAIVATRDVMKIVFIEFYIAIFLRCLVVLQL